MTLQMRTRSIGMLSSLALAVAIAAPAHAQAVAGQAAANEPTAPAPSNPVTGNAEPAGVVAEDNQPGEIVVTAQKRTERLQDVPLAVTAVGGDALASRQINDSTSLAQAVPSLTFQQGAQPLNASFRIRGIGTSLFSQGVESAVSVVVDGVVAARQAQGFADFADIERVEVLRGPQGTLFGRNATAGVLNVVTARPSRDLEGRADFTIAEQGEYRAKGTVSGPISDTLRARITGYYNDVGGFVRNVITNRDVNGQESWGLRGKLDWDATENLNFLAAADYRKVDALCCASTLIRADNPVIRQLTTGVTPSRTNRQISEDIDTFANTEQQTYSLQGDWDLGPATVTSITAFQKYTLANNQPIDRINSNPVLFVGAGAAYAAWPRNGGTVDLENFTQELRLGSNGSRDLTYVVGLYYSDLAIDRGFERRRAICPVGTIVGQPCVAPIFQSSDSLSKLRNESIAAFGQVEYRIAGGLKAIGGIRVQHEDVSLSGVRRSPIVAGDALFPNNAPISGRNSTKDTAVTGKAGLQYEFDRNAQVYGSWTHGYKGPGFDTEISAAFGQLSPINPETVDAYEIGFKGQTPDRTFSLSAAAFLADYSNLQVQANRSDPTTGLTQFITTNAGSSRTKGVELEATLRPADGLSITTGFTYAKATIDIDGLNCPLQFQTAAASPTLTGSFPVNRCYRSSTVVNGATVLSGFRQDIRGGTLPASPRIRVNVAPRYDRELSDTLAGFVQTSINFQSSQNFSLEQDPLLEQPSYTLVDLTIGLRTTDGRYTISAFVKNLFDKNYFTLIGHNSLLATGASPNDLVSNFAKDADRYFGATLGVRF